MMSHRIVVAFALMFLSVGNACRSGRDGALDSTIVALVNGETLLLADFDAELSRELKSLGGSLQRPAEQLEPLRRALLETRIDQMLLLQQAKVLGLSVTPAEVDRRVLRSSADYQGEGFSMALAEGQLSQNEFVQRTMASMTIEKLMAEQVYPRIALTEEEIRHVYDTHADAFSETEQVRASQIVVKTLEEAQGVLAQLRAGKRFDELARKHSLSADATVGGDLGFFPKGVMPAEFDDVFAQMTPGEFSSVVTSPYGFHVLRLIERRPARRRTFVEARAQVEAKLLREKRAAAESDFRKTLRQKANIQVNDVALASAKGQVAPRAEVKTP
ncbi:MAG: peptidyl-prolyl cis-trans isomerase [Myxococcaceae bacterium]